MKRKLKKITWNDTKYGGCRGYIGDIAVSSISWNPNSSKDIDKHTFFINSYFNNKTYKSSKDFDKAKIEAEALFNKFIKSLFIEKE